MAETGAGAALLVDTSVLVRYLTGDPPRLAARAAKVIDSADRVLLTDIVVLETAHVLRTVYGVPREAWVDALGAFVRRSNVRTLDRSKDLLTDALELCRPSGRVSNADALIWAAAASAGAPVATFDRRFPADAIEVRPV